MKFVVVMVVIAVAAARPGNPYEKFDNLDVDEVLGNSKLTTSLLKCMVDDGRCTPEGTDLKNLAPGAVQNKCADCTAEQKTKAAKFMRAAKKDYTELFNKLVKIHDPNNEHTAELDEFLTQN
uniref:Chemosensory protein n=1 Tax=Dendrolimus kikuchii TaxID=765133 RepID=A0A076E979_9NEOP|nr:chemosensory protein [Dendrolimus kikuchii]